MKEQIKVIYDKDQYGKAILKQYIRDDDISRLGKNQLAYYLLYNQNKVNNIYMIESIQLKDDNYDYLISFLEDITKSFGDDQFVLTIMPDLIDHVPVAILPSFYTRFMNNEMRRCNFNQIIFSPSVPYNVLDIMYYDNDIARSLIKQLKALNMVTRIIV